MFEDNIEELARNFVSLHVGMTLYYLKKEEETKQGTINEYVQGDRNLKTYFENNPAKNYGFLKEDFLKSIEKGDISIEQALKISREFNDIANKCVTYLAKKRCTDPIAERIRIQSCL